MKNEILDDFSDKKPKRTKPYLPVIGIVRILLSLFIAYVTIQPILHTRRNVLTNLKDLAITLTFVTLLFLFLYYQFKKGKDELKKKDHDYNRFLQIFVILISFVCIAGFSSDVYSYKNSMQSSYFIEVLLILSAFLIITFEDIRSFWKGR